MPSALPTTASSTLSVSSCRIRRRRPAPSAERIAISPRRDEARTSSRLATFAHAISRTKATVPSSTSNPRRTSSTIKSCAPTTDASGLLALVRRRDAAREGRHVGLGRIDGHAVLEAADHRQRVRAAALQLVGAKISGEYRSPGLPSGNLKSGGITPTTVNGAPVKVIDLPTRLRSPPNRRCQNSWRSTTTRSRRFSSSSVKVRPIERVDTQHAEQAGRHRDRGDALGLAAAGEREAVETIRAKRIEHRVLRLPVQVIRRRDQIAVLADRGVLFPDEDQPLGFAVSQRLQQTHR